MLGGVYTLSYVGVAAAFLLSCSAAKLLDPPTPWPPLQAILPGQMRNRLHLVLLQVSFLFCASAALNRPPPPICLNSQVIFPDQMRKGFTSLVESLDDLLLDVPDAVELLALFICR